MEMIDKMTEMTREDVRLTSYMCHMYKMNNISSAMDLHLSM